MNLHKRLIGPVSSWQFSKLIHFIFFPLIKRHFFTLQNLWKEKEGKLVYSPLFSLIYAFLFYLNLFLICLHVLLKENNVQISDVTYSNLQGTSKTPFAISLNCSQSVPCTLMEFDTVNIVSSDRRVKAKASCINAHGNTKGYINPAIPCLH